MKKTGLSRLSKDTIIKEVATELEANPVFMVTQYEKISAATMDDLRKKLRKANADYVVVKNRLGRKAFEKLKMDGFSEHMTGACGIALIQGDPVKPSKVLVDFAKANEGFRIKQGRLNGQAISADDIKALASLPSREVLLGRVVGQMQAPISRFVGVLAGTLRQVVNVLDAIAKKKG